MKKTLYLICFLCCLSACRNYSAEVTEALVLSGENRPELEKVLNYYRFKNKIAYESACFLIGNMKYHESESRLCLNDSLLYFFVKTDSIYKEIFGNMSLNEIKRYKGKKYDSLRIALGSTFNLVAAKNENTKRRLRDLENIKADFLIDNIESALKIWKANGYTYKNDFDFFKEFILPYRTSNEHPLYKRSFLASMFEEVLTDTISNSIYTKIERYKTYINKCRWINKYVKVRGHLGPMMYFCPNLKWIVTI